MREISAVAAVLVLAACSKSANGKSDAASSGAGADSTAPASMVGAAPGASCPADGLWAQCSILYRLDRAGLAPRLDPTEKVEEQSIGAGAMTFVVKIGRLARLEVFLYPDSVARSAAEKKLDRTQFVGPTDQQTIKRERTLMENANFIGLLTSINSHQRERVSDALMAGPPQPNAKQ
jgi:hypothetical protein